MLRELLLALHGHTGDVFVKELVQVNSDSSDTLEESSVAPKLVFKIDPNFSLIHPSERQVYDRLVQLGCYYFQLKEFSGLYSSNDVPYSRYINALKLGIANILEGYEELIVKVEEGFLSGKDFDYGSTTVSYLMGIFTHYRIVFPDLLNFLESVLSAKMKCAEILSSIYQRTFTGVPSLEREYHTLSAACTRVFYNQILLWMGCGKINDLYDEFFITSINSKYYVEEKNLPTWLSKNAAYSVLFIGRVVAAVQRIDPSHSSRDIQRRATERLFSLTQRTKLVPLELEQTISELRKEISSDLWLNVFSRHLDFKAYIRDFRNLFLLRFGGFFSDFFGKIQKKKDVRGGILLSEMELFFNTDAPGFNKDSAANLSKFRFIEAAPLNPDFIGFLGCKAPIKWTYDLEWPLDLILNENDISSYSELFSYLAGVRYVHLNLYKLSEATLKAPTWWAPFWRSKAMMGYFLDSLWSYIQVDILDPSYLALQADLENSELAYDFDSIQGLHFNYLEHIRLATLLNSKLALYIHSILTIVNKFMVLSYIALEKVDPPPSRQELEYLLEVHKEFLSQVKFLFRALSSLNASPGHVAFKEKIAIFEGQESPEQMKSWDRASKTLDQLLLRLDYNKWFSLYL